MSNFEILKAPSTGAHLIDASAGTGKTYTISGLVVRMIVEYQWPIEDILVVTFTEAAAIDLKARIREMLINVANAFVDQKTPDPFIASLVEATADHQQARRLLNIALRNFDEASIFTIHGFCRRVLQDHFLECGLLLDTVLEKDQWRILREITEDFFRTNFYPASPLYVSYCLKRMLPEQLRRFLGVNYSRDDLRIIPDFDREDIEQALTDGEKDFREKFAAVASAWPQFRNEIEAILLTDEGLNRTKYSRKTIPSWIVSFDRMTSSDTPDIFLFAGFTKFTSSTIHAAMKKGSTAPEHELFSRCGELQGARDRLVELFERQIIVQKHALYRYVKNELATRKEAGGYFTFDDMLKGLATALKGRTGVKLARVVAARYKGALIDEFQDTDPLQYEIFKTIFSGPDSLLLLIGDPKQAIYSFRGADIFAYMQAVDEVDSRYTLGYNWRSVPGLIGATNTIFTNRDVPFLFKEIHFEAALAAEKKHPSFQVDGNVEKTFQIMVLKRGADDDPRRPLSRAEAGRRILSWMSGEVTRLILLGQQGRAMIGERDVCAGDIAILVRTNREARQVQGALAESGVASVLCSSESLFASREAEELLVLLKALASPGESGRLRAALATRFLDSDVRELDVLDDGKNTISFWIEKFREYHDLWMSRGFSGMFSNFLDREKVRPRLLKSSRGERIVTNLLHLYELLHLVSVEKRLGVFGLCKHLEEMVAEAAHEVPDEHQLRLESESELVQIVTIHKSKGLQYPIVFCPFSWEKTKVPKINSGKLPVDSTGLLYHEREKNFELVLDIGSSDVAVSRNVAFQEELAENLRLLYVAFTRAVQRCYFFTGPIKDSGTSAAAYLLHYRGDDLGEGLSPERLDVLAKLDDSEIHDNVMRLVAAGEGNIALAQGDSLPPPGSVVRETSEGECPEFVGRVERSWGVSSFSAIAHEFHDPGERVSLSTGHAGPGDEAYFDEIKNFPRGPGPGVFFHSLLEGLDFTCAAQEKGKAWIEKCLTGGGYDLEWRRAIEGMIGNLLKTPLPSIEGDVRLAEIDNQNRLNELEFYFPIQDFSLKELAGFLADEFGVAVSEKVLSTPGKNRLRGFMKGYIDLVFYAHGRYHIVDWKSNHLGYAEEDYSFPGLERVMERELYTLQYLIYSVALHRYLEHRMPEYNYEKHFGGVYYLFLRGFRSDGENRFGVYAARPKRESVLKATSILVHSGNPEPLV